MHVATTTSISILDRVFEPADLADLTADELTTLAEEIRGIIVESVLEHGGHLGSNLGAVELTLALHRVFASPQDLILWDTGHQTYAHKLVTGRRAGFASLRQAGGMSGYPSRDESAHDVVENSHASTILSYAHGLGAAERSRTGQGRRIVAIIGDGALTGGMAYEGLNNLGHSAQDCVIVLNDNGRSYAPTVSRLGAGLHDRVAPQDAGDPAEFFGSLGLGYIGPVDGHDIEAVEQALRDAAERGGPQVVHAITRKGKGYEPAELDPVKCLHDTSEAKPGSFTVGFGQSLVELAAEDPRIVAITAAMPDSTGLLPFATHFPDRFFDVGIAEQHAVTAAAGMAMGGLVPVVAVYATFLTRAIDQVIYDVGLHRLPVIFCLDRAGITGDDGASHHGVLDMVLLSKVPGLTILAPSSYDELGVMLRDAVAIATGPEPGPVAIRWSKTAPPRSFDDGVGRGTRARLLREGDDVCLVAVGKAVEASLHAADLLANHGLGVSVWDARCVKPLDPRMIEHASRHRWVVTIEDGLREGGIGMTVADRIAERTAGDDHAPRTRVLGTPLAYIPHGKPEAVLAELGLGPHGIAEQTLDLITSRNPSQLAGAFS